MPRKGRDPAWRAKSSKYPQTYASTSQVVSKNSQVCLRRLSQQFGHADRTSKWADHSDEHDHNRSHDTVAQAEACYDASEKYSRKLPQHYGEGNRNFKLTIMIAMMVMTTSSTAGHTTTFAMAVACYDDNMP